MAAVTVTGTIKNTAVVEGVRVEIDLVASTTDPDAHGYVLASDFTWGGTIRLVTSSLGVFSTTLEPVANLTPAGCAYRLKYTYPDGTHPAPEFIAPTVSPATQRVEDILVDEPASIASAALSSHLQDPMLRVAQPVLLELDRAAENISILIVGDSTSDTGSGAGTGSALRWPVPWAALIAAEWPAYTVAYYQWGDASASPTYVYPAPTIVQAGTNGQSEHALASGTGASGVITDASIVSADLGKRVTGKNIPPGAKVGTVTNGVSFVLFDAIGNTIYPWGTVLGIKIGTDPVLHIYNASVGSTRWLYGFGSRVDAMYARVQPNLIIANHGNNESDPTDGPANGRDQFRSTYLCGVEMLTALCPGAPVILIGQGPRTDSDSADQPVKNAVTAEIANMRGYGYVDVYQAFLDNSNYVSEWLSDEVHPNTAGSAVWAAEVQKQFDFPTGHRASPPAQLPSLFQTAPSEQLTPSLADYIARGVTPADWTTSSATIVVDSSTFAFRTAKVTSTAALGRVEIPLTIADVAGQWITATALVRYTNSGASLGCGCVAIRYTDVNGTNHTELAGYGGGNAVDAWWYNSISARIPADATAATICLFGDATGAGSAVTWYRDLVVSRGRLPSGPVPSPTSAKLQFGGVTDAHVVAAATIQPSKIGLLTDYAECVGPIFPGTTGNYFSTPDSATLDLTTVIELRVKLPKGLSTRPSAQSAMVAKWGAAANRSWAFVISTAGALSFFWTTDGSTSVNANTGASLLDATLLTDLWVKAVWEGNNAGQYRVRFYTSTDGSSYTQLGSTTNGAVGTQTLFNSTAVVEIGSVGSGTSQNFTGAILSAEIASAVGGANIASWAFTNPAASTYTPGTGEVWTMYGLFTWRHVLSSSVVRSVVGTPEGAVTAPVGSIVTRSDGGANTTLYVKESGSGNTGWVAK